jgi:hypothetical protein
MYETHAAQLVGPCDNHNGNTKFGFMAVLVSEQETMPAFQTQALIRAHVG